MADLSAMGFHEADRSRRRPGFSRRLLLGSLRAQTQDKKDEIPIERCDLLPVVTIKVARENRRFLLDTAATTILNLKSFRSGKSKEIDIYSWSGGTDQLPRSSLAATRFGHAQAARSEAPGD